MRRRHKITLQPSDLYSFHPGDIVHFSGGRASDGAILATSLGLLLGLGILVGTGAFEVLLDAVCDLFGGDE